MVIRLSRFFLANVNILHTMINRCSAIILLVMLECILPFSASAMTDSTFYKTYEELVTGRFYFSRKYTGLLIKDPSSGIELNYKPNTTLNMGVGATYRSFTLNLAYGFPFINPDRGRGDTRYLDLQAHFYGRKSNIDLFGQFYNGLYLSPKGYGRDDNKYYVRPDLRLREFGGSYQYIFNSERFSFRSSFLQNERQKRSAGTLLIGGEFFIGKASADSSVYPTLSISGTRPNTELLRFYEVGPNIGYAYTLVIARHFFVTGSITLAADYSLSEFEGPNGTTSVSGFNPNSMLRLFAGYNSDRSAISITFTNSRVNIDSQKNLGVSINTGNIRLNYIRRFHVDARTQRRLDQVFGR
jgi:hypothetical protein